MAIFEPVWAADGTAEPMSEAQVRAGFTCGAANPFEFNWIIQQIQSSINSLDVESPVQQARQINTAEGIQGGGDLSADRTLTLHINGLDVETSIANDDLIAIYDTSAAQHKAMTRANLIAGLGGDGGDVSGAANIGGADGEFFSALSGTDLEFRTLEVGGGLVVATVGDKVVVSHANYASELTVE